MVSGCANVWNKKCLSIRVGQEFRQDPAFCLQVSHAFRTPVFTLESSLMLPFPSLVSIDSLAFLFKKEKQMSKVETLKAPKFFHRNSRRCPNPIFPKSFFSQNAFHDSKATQLHIRLRARPLDARQASQTCRDLATLERFLGPLLDVSVLPPKTVPLSFCWFSL